MASLNPQQFTQPLFHGTTHNIKGGTVLPRMSAGIPHRGSWEQPGSSGRAHASSSERVAWGFAEMSSSDRAKLKSETTGKPATMKRARVYEVTPASDTHLGVEHKAHPDFGKSGQIDSAEHLSHIGFPVKRRIDIQPPAPGEQWRQGTFPQVNWNKHAKSQTFVDDKNHPTQFQSERENPQPAPVRPQQASELPGQGALFSDRRYRPPEPDSSIF